MKDKLVVVGSYLTELEASFAKDVLEKEGIDTVSQGTDGYAANSKIGLDARIRLFVTKQDEEKAIDLLKTFEENSVSAESKTDLLPSDVDCDSESGGFSLMRSRFLIFVPATLIMIVLLILAIVNVRDNIVISLFSLYVCVIIVFGVKGHINTKKHNWQIRLSAFLTGLLCTYFFVFELMNNNWGENVGGRTGMSSMLLVALLSFVFSVWPRKKKSRNKRLHEDTSPGGSAAE